MYFMSGNIPPSRHGLRTRRYLSNRLNLGEEHNIARWRGTEYVRMEGKAIIVRSGEWVSYLRGRPGGVFVIRFFRLMRWLVCVWVDLVRFRLEYCGTYPPGNARLVSRHHFSS